MSLSNKTIIITGATRGIGRGLALGLAEQGAHIVVTGRTATGEFSLASVKQDIEKLGGSCDTYVVDHDSDEAVTNWFKKMNEDLSNSGKKIDIFVNNAYAAAPFLSATADIPFWRKGVPGDETLNPGAYWDKVNGVGLRGHFVCAVHATRAMINTGGGLIINITSLGTIISLFDPVYGVGKTAIDRMTAELNMTTPDEIKCISFSPGVVSTEVIMNEIEENERTGKQNDEKILTWNMETPLYVGRSLAAFVNDEKLIKSAAGKVVVAAEIADRFGIKDENHFQPLSIRSLRVQMMDSLPWTRNTFLPNILPRSLYIPWYIVQKSMGAYQLWG